MNHEPFSGLLLSTRVDPTLTERIGRELGAKLTDPGLVTFDNSEIGAQIETHVRGKETVLVGAIARSVDGRSANDALMELLIVSDALARASARTITLVIPYFGYGKQERKVKGRQPITARVVADLISLGISRIGRIITLDLHAGAIQGFFRMPLDHLTARPLIVEHLKATGYGGDDTVVISPDAGGVQRASDVAERIGSELAIMLKRRVSSTAVVPIELMGPVKGKRCVIVDDLVQSGSTLVACAELLRERGATEVIACATHADFTGDLAGRIERSALERLVVTDSLPISRDPAVADSKLISVLPIAPLLAKAIHRNQTGESISALFD